jgi:lysophospholipase L1-like esterase
VTSSSPVAYVALGDSISIDDYAGGPGRGGASLLFRNRDDDFPEWRGRDLASGDPEATFALLATDGATTRSLLDAQLPRLAATGLRPTLVTLTIGGNDVLTCYGDTRAARRTVVDVGRAVARALDELAPRLAPQGRVVVGTVYDPSDGTGDGPRLGLPPWPEAVPVLAELNDVLREVASRSGADVAEIAQHFSGHGVLAGDPSRPEPRPAQRDLWFCQVIEPNAWGAGGVRQAFWEAASPV